MATDPSMSERASLRPAAQYLRMSTEHQRYSLEHQTGIIAAFARRSGFEIVRSYADPGRSGLHIEGRPALSELLKDVVGGQAKFEAVLVLDVSRWGRFQDPDEGAHYEFICRSAGVAVHYCDEAFQNDGSLFSSLIKQIKRTMAAEYSRDLGVRIHLVQRALAAKGYRMSGAPGYGLRRLVLDESGQPCTRLEAGERKAVQGRRIILAPGPEEEVATVGRIFRLFVITGMTKKGIAELLNREGIAAERGAAWTAARVRGVLTNEKYMGDNVYGRTRSKLTRRPEPQPPETWVRCEGAFAPIVSRKRFEEARALAAGRAHFMSDEQMLAALRSLHRKKRFLCARLINDSPATPCVALYARRFGGLQAAYRLIGYDRGAALRQRHARLSDAETLKRLCALKTSRGRLSASIINACEVVPGVENLRARFGSLANTYARVGYDGAGLGETRLRTDPPYTEAAMLEGLRRIWAREGRLSVKLVDAEPDLPCRSTYVRRFGSMRWAFEQVGYRGPRLVGCAAKGSAARQRRLRRRKPKASTEAAALAGPAPLSP